MECLTCSKCILHNKIPGVVINESSGVCSICESYSFKTDQDKEITRYFTNKLNRVIDKVKSLSVTPNALVLFSGGKDSTFLINMLKEKYGLSILAFSVIHPLVNEVAAANMEEAAKKLDVQLIKFFPRKEEYCRLIKYALLHDDPLYADERIGCNTCSYIFKNAALNYAIKNNIPLVFDGTDKVQNETPIFIEGKKLKKNLECGIGPFDPLHKMAIDALGEEYRGSLYDLDYGTLKNYSFPSFISPLTFLDYKFQNNFSVFNDLGLDDEKFKTIFTNCDAVPFFSYFSIKKYNCLTYVKHYANEIRKQSPYFGQSKLEYQQNEAALPKEIIEALLNEYKNAVLYVVDHKINSSNITNKDKKYLKSIAINYYKIYGDDVCNLFIQQLAKVNEYADFFDIELNTLK